MKLHWNILDKHRKAILPLLKNIKEEGFYLAGGTGLALQLGHRDSIDFDFFKQGGFDTEIFTEKLGEVFLKHNINITQNEKNTVSCELTHHINLSFFGTPYKLIKPLVTTEHFDIASIEDIACMKMLAITHRAVEKDYVDLYFILQKLPLKQILTYCNLKYPSVDELMLVKAITSLDDVETKEPIKFKEGHKITMQKLKKFYANLKNNYQQQMLTEAILRNKLKKDNRN